ncbi:MAG: anthranilate phosphoribosyltransferase [Nostocoides sp.]|uniref:anthranilate phosphoribosyltransferase n=1 Tax=Nostocoides sp. TaxID=1917966 RepID=UPI003C75EECD
MSGAPGPVITWPDVLTALVGGQELSAEQAGWAMDRVFSGDATPSQVAGFVVGLRAKGETVREVHALADVMLAHAHRIPTPPDSIDIVGTGGDRAHTVNISTMSALVLAGAGLRVLKHGNRAASSSSGSADVLEALGVELGLSPERVAAVGEAAGITFCFAQAFHPAMRHAAPTRRELGIGTIFNSLGPLTNPGQPTYAAVGVAETRVADLIAGVFAARGRPAIVFRGDDGLDELTLSGPSHLWWVSQGIITRYVIAPGDFGLALAPIEALRGGDPAHNAEVVRELLAGRGAREQWAVRDAVLLNAGAALALARGGVSAAADPPSITAAIRSGIAQARESIDSGEAAACLERWIAAARA